MSASRNGFCLLYSAFIVISCDAMSMGSDNNYAAVKSSSSILAHAIVMVLITIIGLPFSFYLLTANKQRQHQLAQVANVLLVLIFGFYATFTFSSHSMTYPIIHNPFSLVTMFLLLLQLACQSPCQIPCFTALNCCKTDLFKKVIKYLFVLIMALLMPFSVMTGFEMATMTHPYHPGYLISHFFPAFMFAMIGILSLWNLNNISNIMKYEMIGLLTAPLLQAMGDLTTIITKQGGMKSLTMGAWDHLTLASMMVFCGVFCAIYYCLHLNKRDLFHRMTVAFAFILFGYAMINHKRGNGATAVVHELTGYVMMVAAVFRAFGRVFISSVMLTVIGVFFNFGNPNISSFWTDHLKYPTTPYIVLAICVGFYVLMINLIFKEIYIRQGTDYEENDGFVNLSKNDDTRLSIVPFLTETEADEQTQKNGETFQNLW